MMSDGDKESKMTNFKPLLKHELLRHIYSLKFLTMCIFAVVVTVLCVYVQIMDFHDRKIIYDEENVKADNDIRSAKVYSQVRVPIIIEPNPLSIFIRGSESQIGNKIVISPIQIPEFENTSQTKNSLLNIFSSFDLITLVHIMFSVMTLFLVSDTIAGEREMGTLKQIFSNHVLKSQYFLAKYIGCITILIIPLILIYLIASILLVLQPYISLSFTQWISIGFTFLCCLAFISIYILIGLILSSRCFSSSVAVLYGLILWIVLVFIYPNLSNYLVDNSVEIPSSDMIEQQIENFHDEISQETKSATTHLQSGGSYNWYSTGQYGIAHVIGLTQKVNYENNEKKVRLSIPIILEGHETIMRQQDQFKQQFIRQRRIAGIFVRLLPGHLLKESASKIVGTHYLERDIRLMSHAKRFRESLIQYVRSKDGFGLKFFTQMQEEDMRDDWDDYSEEIESRASPNNYPPLDLSDMPTFRPAQRQLIPNESLVDLIWMCIMNIVLFVVGGLLFSRSEVRIKE